MIKILIFVLIISLLYILQEFLDTKGLENMNFVRMEFARNFRICRPFTTLTVFYKNRLIQNINLFNKKIAIQINLSLLFIVDELIIN